MKSTTLFTALTLAAVTPFVFADNCNKGVLYCGYTLLNKGMRSSSLLVISLNTGSPKYRKLLQPDCGCSIYRWVGHRWSSRPTDVVLLRRRQQRGHHVPGLLPCRLCWWWRGEWSLLVLFKATPFQNDTEPRCLSIVSWAEMEGELSRRTFHCISACSWCWCFQFTK